MSWNCSVGRVRLSEEDVALQVREDDGELAGGARSVSGPTVRGGSHPGRPGGHVNGSGLHQETPDVGLPGARGGVASVGEAAGRREECDDQGGTQDDDADERGRAQRDREFVERGSSEAGECAPGTQLRTESHPGQEGEGTTPNSSSVGTLF